MEHNQNKEKNECTGCGICFGPLFKSLRLEKRPKTYGAPCKWAEILNRIRNGSFTKEDIDLLKTRLIKDLDSSDLSEACHIVFINLEGDGHNEKRLLGFKSKLKEPVAVCTGPS